MSGPRPVRAPRGTEPSALGWQQEAALRMLQNNLDPDVAERPQDLVVYGGIGKAARNWECFDAILDSLRRLGEDESLLVQSGKPVGVRAPLLTGSIQRRQDVQESIHREAYACRDPDRCEHRAARH